MSRSRKIWLLLGLLLCLGLLGMAAAMRWAPHAVALDDTPVVQVKRGDLDSKIYATGELRPSRSNTLSAPEIGGGSLQITHLLHGGTTVKKDGIVVEFDPSEQQFKLEQSRSELEQGEEEITKAKADAAVQTAQDKVALLKARFDVRRAELEVGKNELASAIDAKKNELALDEANRALAQLEQDIKSHAVSGRATIGLAEEKLHKAKLAMDQAQQNIEKMKVRAPMDGIIAIERNTDSTGGMFWGGMSIPDYHEGDQTNPGSPIARVIDPSEMEISSKLDERERSNVKIGDVVEIRLDALPGQTFSGTVATVAGMASKNFFDDEQGGHFEITVKVPTSDARLRAGFTAQLVIAGDVRKNVLYVPRQAVFMKDGKRVVYLSHGGNFDPQEVKVVAETESRAVIEGMPAGTEVAFVDPSAARHSSSHASTEPSLGGGH